MNYIAIGLLTNQEIQVGLYIWISKLEVTIYRLASRGFLIKSGTDFFELVGKAKQLDLRGATLQALCFRSTQMQGTWSLSGSGLTAYGNKRKIFYREIEEIGEPLWSISFSAVQQLLFSLSPGFESAVTKAYNAFSALTDIWGHALLNIPSLRLTTFE